MRTLLPDPPPAEFEALLERRRRWGGDIYDEVWEGVLHMNPVPAPRHGDLQMQIGRLLTPGAEAAGLRTLGPFNVGERDDFRIPDGGLAERGLTDPYLPTASLVIEVVSPRDDTWRKLDFYAAHDVDELLIVDPETRTVNWLALTGGAYESTERSRVIDLSADELAGRLQWPG